MKAAVYTHYGPPEVLQIRDVAEPVPGKDDVRIRIRATAVTASECFIRAPFRRPGLSRDYALNRSPMPIDTWSRDTRRAAS